MAAAEAHGWKPGILPQVGVSVPRGFYDSACTIKLTSPVEGALIRYTTDGSEPTLGNGSDYRDALLITNTTVLRATAFRQRTAIASVSTHTYLFLGGVLHQPRNPPKLLTGPTAWGGEPSMFEMNPGVVNDPRYKDRLIPALKSLPGVSIACRPSDLFGPRTGLYVNSLNRGRDWERSCSVEFLLPNGGEGFQIDCGIRIQGNYNRIPEKSPKHSFRLLFKESYGSPKLHYRVFPDSPVEKFDTLVLRADYNNSWIHWDGAGRARAQRTRDAWMKDSQRAMGWVSPHNRYVHLYLNGLYWGVYDLAERPDASFAAAYLGGQRQDYDVINEFQVKGGTATGFNALYSLGDLSRRSAYEKLRQSLDLPQFIDYLLLNYYAGNQDWGENKNWYAVRRRAPPGPFQYFVWDGEQVLQEVGDDTVNSPYEAPFRLAETLRENPEFRLAFADHVQKHCFAGGALTPQVAADRWMKRANELDLAIVAESARWGAYRRDPPYTRDRDWLAEQNRLIRNYFPRRTAIVLEQFRAAELFPKVAAPAFNRRSGPVENGFKLAMTSSGDGSIYFTTNGTDPRVYGTGAVSPFAVRFTAPWPVGTQVQVNARALKGNTWSALACGSWTNSPTQSD